MGQLLLRIANSTHNNLEGCVLHDEFSLRTTPSVYNYVKDLMQLSQIDSSQVCIFLLTFPLKFNDFYHILAKTTHFLKELMIGSPFSDIRDYSYEIHQKYKNCDFLFLS